MPTFVDDYTSLLSGTSVHGTVAKGAFLTFSFATGNASYLTGHYSQAALDTFREMTAVEKDAARAAITMFAEQSGLVFFEVTGESDMVFGAYDLAVMSPGFAGFAYLPIGTGEDALQSDVFLDYAYAADTRVLLHEIGHAIGLKHPFEGDVQLNKDIDNFSTTVMSYTYDAQPVDALRAMDIEAMQHIYGTNDADGDHVAAWSWDSATYTLTQTGFETAETIEGVATADVIHGNGGNDLIYGEAGNDILNGGAGDDTIRSGAGNDIANGGIGNDTIYGEAGANELNGGEGNDTLRGGADTEELHGDDGNDTIYGGAGDDAIAGGIGNDVIFSDGGFDHADGGEGDDTFVITYSGTPIFYDFDGEAGTDTLQITIASGLAAPTLSIPDSIAAGSIIANVEKLLILGNGNGNTITGSSVSDQIQTGNGSDKLYGGDGGDIFFSGGGADTIVGGLGLDHIYTGTVSGADKIVYLAATDSDAAGRDQIYEFENGIDTVDLTALKLSAAQVSTQISGSNTYVTAGALTFWVIGNTTFSKSDIKLVNEPVTTSLIDVGTNGTTGVHGSANPQGAGGTGTSGETISLNVIELAADVTQHAVSATGGNGGTGGNGWFRNDVEEFDDFGGPGGHGGVAGAAGALVDGIVGSASLMVEATGGKGGQGGEGRGGGTHREHEFDPETGEHRDWEEHGGDGGIGGNGAHGGDAAAKILDSTLTLAQFATYELRAVAKGGAGGAGGEGGSGGHGGMTFNPFYEYPGGEGAPGGFAGNGGSAEARIENNDIAISATQLLVYAQAGGGAGGTGGTAGWDEKYQWSWDHIYPQPKSGGHAGSATAAIVGNDITGSDQVEAVTFDLSGVYALGGARGEMREADPEFVTSTAGQNSAAALSLTGNNVALGGGNDSLTLRIAQHEGGSLVFTGNSFQGGAGNDTLVLDVSLLTPAGTATNGLTFNLAANNVTGFERIEGSAQNDVIAGDNVGMTIFGFGGNDQLSGGALHDALNGGEGNDRLDGGASDDAMTGGAGDDTYYVDHLLDMAYEADGEGIDTVISSVTFFISGGQYLENLTLTGTAVNGYGNGLDNVLTGNSGANMLDGSKGNDTLDSGGGADTLVGGLGDDLFIVSDVNAKVREKTGEGIDTVKSSVSFNLGGQFADNLTLTGLAANGTGNSLANTLTGNGADNNLRGGEGNDTLIGGGGNDTLAGELGDDRYEVADAGDKVIEADSQGQDLVESAVNFSLAGQFIEKLTLTGAALTGTGNGLDNVLIGNGEHNVLRGGSGNDSLTGAGGNDTLMGELGDDRYVVEGAGDKVIEANDAGYDTVASFVSFSLAGQYLEALELTGDSAINGTGNGLANTIKGNAGNNRLSGGGGSDDLTGGHGQDIFLFDATIDGNANVDRILDFSSADDVIHLSRSQFGRVAKGVLSEADFVTGTQAADSGDRILYDSATGNIFYDADGNGAGAAILFAVVETGSVLTAADFFAI